MVTALALLPAALTVQGGLLELRCEFVERLPVVTVTWATGGKPRESRFLLDSGAEGSLFLRVPDAPTSRLKADGAPISREVRLWTGSGAKRSELGRESFVTLPPASMTRDLNALMDRLRVVGIIGADFFADHDVLLDYGAGRIFASPPLGEEAPQPIAGLERLSLMPWGTWRLAGVTLNEKPVSTIFAVLDTATSVTVLPTSAAPNGRPAGGKATSVVTLFATYAGWIERRRVTLAPLTKPFDLDVSFVGEATPALRPGDLGDRVLLRFRHDEAWIERGRSGTD